MVYGYNHTKPLRHKEEKNRFAGASEIDFERIDKIDIVPKAG